MAKHTKNEEKKMNKVVGIVAIAWAVLAAFFIALIREGTRGDSKEMDMRQFEKQGRVKNNV